MDDLVERLRFERNTCGIHSGEGYGLTGILRLQKLLAEAADRVERLEEELRGVTNFVDKAVERNMLTFDGEMLAGAIADHARATLSDNRGVRPR